MKITEKEIISLTIFTSQEESIESLSIEFNSRNLDLIQNCELEGWCLELIKKIISDEKVLRTAP